MSASSAPSPVRVGILGLGRRGSSALEGWLESDAIRVVAACDQDMAARDVAASLCDRIVDDIEGLLANDDVEAVLLTVPIRERAALARRVLAAGKNLVTEPVLAETVGEADLLYAAAGAWGRKIAVWSPWRDERGFRAALSVARSNESGPLRLIRFERWEPRIETTVERMGTIEVPLPWALLHRLDQLIALVGTVPTEVFAATLPDGGTVATIRFGDGVTASVMLHSSSSTRIDQDWAIDGERGGYAGGRRWVRAADGEIYDVPAESPPNPTPDETVRDVLTGARPDQRVDSLRLIALATAVAESLEIGQVIAVEPVP